MRATPVFARTSAKCPVSGIWKVDGAVSTTQPVIKGKPMPDYCGKAVRWQLLYAC